MDRNDINHSSAKDCYSRIVGKEALAISLPILTESWLLIEARLGLYFANQLWKVVVDGIFDLLEINLADLKEALAIEQKYQKVGFGIVDATSFVLCEKYQIRKVFTYDRKHFGLYRPRFTNALELLPH